MNNDETPEADTDVGTSPIVPPNTRPPLPNNARAERQRHGRELRDQAMNETRTRARDTPQIQALAADVGREVGQLSRFNGHKSQFI